MALRHEEMLKKEEQIQQKKYWAALKLLPGFDLHWQVLVGAFRSPENIYKASEKDLAGISNLAPATISKMLYTRESIDIDAEFDKLRSLEISLISIDEDNYPKQLKNIFNPPPVLYVKGDLINTMTKSVAIVGTRRATAYGRTVAANLATDLSKAGVTVVSGVAYGIDKVAHVEALKYEGNSVGVVGSGLDVIYPRENSKIWHEIASKGSLVSEYPPGTSPLKYHFPARNRIISGLSSATVVVEAPAKSGALITANFALDQGREVLVVPGSIVSGKNAGGHSLLRSGASLCESAQDVFDQLSWRFEKEELTLPGVSFLEWRILEQLGWDSIQIEDLISKLDIDVSSLTSALMMLELKGYVKQEIGKRFLRVN